jgi:hypothetical protein
VLAGGGVGDGFFLLSRRIQVALAQLLMHVEGLAQVGAGRWRYFGFLEMI